MFEGLKITVQSTIEAVKFLLQHHVKYVLTERFCQDPLENYFGQQSAIGARKDNPSFRDFGFNYKNCLWARYWHGRFHQ